MRFSFSAIDDYDVRLFCQLYVDNEIRKIGYLWNDTKVYWPLERLNLSNHNWYVNCTDSENYSNNSETRQFFLENWAIINSISN